MKNTNMSCLVLLPSVVWHGTGRAQRLLDGLDAVGFTACMKLSTTIYIESAATAEERDGWMWAGNPRRCFYIFFLASHWVSAQWVRFGLVQVFFFFSLSSPLPFLTNLPSPLPTCWVPTPPTVSFFLPLCFLGFQCAEVLVVLGLGVYATNYVSCLYVSLSCLFPWSCFCAGLFCPKWLQVGSGSAYLSLSLSGCLQIRTSEALALLSPVGCGSLHIRQLPIQLLQLLTYSQPCMGLSGCLVGLYVVCQVGRERCCILLLDVGINPPSPLSPVRPVVWATERSIQIYTSKMYMQEIPSIPSSRFSSRLVSTFDAKPNHLVSCFV